MRRLLFLFVAFVLASASSAQDLIRYYPPAGVSTSTSTPGFSYASNVGSLVNGGTAGTPVPQTFNVYNFCDGLNCATGYERLRIGSSGTGSVEIFTEKAGTGGSRVLSIQSGSYLSLGGGGGTYVAFFDNGNFYKSTTDTGTIGQAANLWSNGYFSRAIQGSKSKALTDATATAFVRIAIPQTIATNYKGGQVIYEIYCDDDTNQASQAGTVKFTCHNLAGTEACGFGTPDGVTLGDGTVSLAAPTFDATSSAADTIDLRVNSDCTGAAPNTHTIEWRLDMPTTATITPQ